MFFSTEFSGREVRKGQRVWGAPFGMCVATPVRRSRRWGGPEPMKVTDKKPPHLSLSDINIKVTVCLFYGEHALK